MFVKMQNLATEDAGSWDISLTHFGLHISTKSAWGGADSVIKRPAASFQNNNLVHYHELSTTLTGISAKPDSLFPPGLAARTPSKRDLSHVKSFCSLSFTYRCDSARRFRVLSCPVRSWS
jgi:hypothetical protein